PLRRVDREEPDHVSALLLCGRLELRGADRVLLGYEADEALDVRPAQLLERPRQPRELAQVRVAAAPVPLRQHGQVVVVLADDLLAKALESRRRRLRGEPVEALPERLEKPRVARGQTVDALLDPGVERTLRRGAAQEHEAVV